jgi:hypothetical protein
MHHFYRRGALHDQNLLIDLSAVGVFLIYGLGLAVFVRSLYWRFASIKMRDWNRSEILLLIPLGQLVSGSMSSGGGHVGLYGPIAIMILLLPISSPVRLKWEWARNFALAMAAILAVHCAANKYMYPYSWHSYRVGPLFVGREWYRHPEYGPMVIDPQLLQFIKPVCAAVSNGEGERELLSLPYSYPNYFCSIEPWHGYVQTFFDTSTSATIFSLMDELEKAPPKWIVYQRQLDNLALHERTYNQGKPLPHRYLDQMIEQKISSGAWRAVYTSTYGSYPEFTNKWIVIQTR